MAANGRQNNARGFVSKIPPASLPPFGYFVCVSYAMFALRACVCVCVRVCVRGYVCVQHTHSSHTHASARTPLPTCSSIKDPQAAAENVRTFGLMTSQRGPGRSQSSGNSGGGSTVYACPKCKRKFKDRQGLAYHYDNTTMITNGPLLRRVGRILQRSTGCTALMTNKHNPTNRR